MLGQAYVESGNLEKAQRLIEDIFDKILNKYGHVALVDKEIKYQIACILAALNQNDQAIQLLQEINFPVDIPNRIESVNPMLYESLKNKIAFQKLFSRLNISMPLMEPLGK